MAVSLGVNAWDAIIKTNMQNRHYQHMQCVVAGLSNISISRFYHNPDHAHQRVDAEMMMKNTNKSLSYLAVNIPFIHRKIFLSTYKNVRNFYTSWEAAILDGAHSSTIQTIFEGQSNVTKFELLHELLWQVEWFTMPGKYKILPSARQTILPQIHNGTEVSLYFWLTRHMHVK